MEDEEYVWPKPLDLSDSQVLKFVNDYVEHIFLSHAGTVHLFTIGFDHATINHACVQDTNLRKAVCLAAAVIKKQTDPKTRAV